MDTPMSRAEVSARLLESAEFNVIAEWICCEPLAPGHDLCAKGYAALNMVKALLVDSPDAYKPAPLLDDVMELLKEGETRSQSALLELASVLHIPRPGNGLPMRVVRERTGEDRWSIGDGTEGRRWNRRYGWVYEATSGPGQSDMRFSLTEAVALARDLVKRGE